MPDAAPAFFVVRIGNRRPRGKRGRHGRLPAGRGAVDGRDDHDTRAIQHYLGHKNIQHTVRYTELSADRFKTFWGD